MDLEEELGVPLFDRQRRQMHLNQAGVLFRQRASMMLALLEQAENELPNAGAALLAVGFEQEFFQRVALPVAAVGLAIAADDVFHGVTFFA